MESPSRWAIHTIRPLEKYASGSVILLGDAVRIPIHSYIVATVLINFYWHELIRHMQWHLTKGMGLVRQSR